MSIFFLCAVRKIHKIDDLSLYSLCSLHNIRYRIFAGFLPVFHRKFDTLTFAFPFFPNIFGFFNFRCQKSLPFSSFPPIPPSFRIFPRFQAAFQAFSARFRRPAPPEAATPAHAFAPLCLSTGGILTPVTSGTGSEWHRVKGDYRRLRVIPSQRARWRGNPLLNGTGERSPPMPCS